MTDAIAQLCAQVGVHTHYRSFDGQTVRASRETLTAVLRAMGFGAGSDDEARDAVRQLQAEADARALPPEVIVFAGQASQVTLAQPAEWIIEAEGTAETLGAGQAEHALTVPPLPIGIHRMRLTTAAAEQTTWVLARPARAVQLEDHMPGARIWGVLAALYGLTDGAAAQIGSYAHLGGYAAAIASHGADFIGINPVHAMGQVRPDDVISPYSPSHRGFLNTWHCGGQDGSGDAGELIDYPEALCANAAALSAQFEAFTALPDGAPDVQAFESFARQAGAPLHEFALFEALAAKYGADWRDWPAPYRDHDGAALAKFGAEHAKAIRLTTWAQWQAETQLSRAQAKARAAGMRVGLYLDLAVGPRLGGAETWVPGTPLVTGATLGAPPDPLGPEGQSWGLAPLSPIKCRAEGYAGFAQLLRSIMRHAGMIRIDHVLGLMRSFWIPEGGAEGAYVSYPFEALLAVVAIESARNNTVVVGEDLGLVPEGLREALAKSGIYGLDVMQYMRTETGGFVDPAQTRQQAIFAFATHDTPTVAGFFAAEDAKARHAFGGIDQCTFAQTKADRARAVQTLAGPDPVRAVHQQLARSNASMVAVQLDDIAGRRAQQNLPGTVETYPNWQLKAPFTAADIAGADAFATLARDMAAQGRANPTSLETQDDLANC